jgi:hypothetical protein
MCEQYKHVWTDEHDDMDGRTMTMSREDVLNTSHASALSSKDEATL